MFHDRFHRLDSLNNWGVLAWLYPHATATKQAHHLGVERNAIEFLSLDPARRQHRPSLRLAAHVMHWGHIPLSYAGAEGLLRAASVRDEVKRVLADLVDEVVTKGDLRCSDSDHQGRCAEAVKEGDRPFELYRWVAAWLLLRSWKPAWKAVKEIEQDTDLDEANVRSAAIRSLVCRDDDGYQILARCNLADYVPRDLLQCGTAWLTVDLERFGSLVL